jgi:hypothetical protein
VRLGGRSPEKRTCQELPRTPRYILTPGPAERATMTMPTASGPTWPNSRYGPFGAARTEARGLTRLVEHGRSPESVRNLVTVSPQIEAELHRHAARVAGRYPEEAQHLLGMIAWRRQVLVEFDRLLQEEAAGASNAHFAARSLRRAPRYRDTRCLPAPSPAR